MGRLRLVARLALLVIGLALGVGAWAGPAMAHAALIASTPNDGAALDAAPGEIVLEFTEHISAPPQALRVFDSAAKRVDMGDSRAGPEPKMLRVGLQQGLPDGFYIVSWRAISADTHPISGAFGFTVGDPAAANAVSIADVLGDQRQPGFEVAAGVGRWITFLGTLLAAGGVAFLAFAHDGSGPERQRLTRVVRIAALAALAATLVAVPLQAVLVTGLGARALVDPVILGQTLTSTYGLAALARLAGLALLLAGVARLVWLGAAGGLVALGSLVAAGHTITTEPRWLALSANYAHAVTGAIWFGGLVLLTLALASRRTAADAVGGARMVSRFSTLATGSVVVVVIAGLALAWTEVRTLGALTSTAYGWTLMAKFALVMGIVAIGAYNNRRLVPAVQRGAEGAWRLLSRTVRLEAAGIVVVLAVTALLVNLPPARTAAGVGEIFSGYAPLGPDYQVGLTVDPNQAGPNAFHMYLLEPNGQPADIAQTVQLRMELPAKDIAPIEREPLVAGPGHYTYTGPELSIPGRWEIEVVVDVSQFERLTAAFDVDVGGR